MGHVVSAAAEAVLDKELPVLDVGFVRLVDYMGSDASVVQAARVSYGGGTKTTREDRGLVRYLMKNGHTSPFEMVVLKFHVRAPLFVARQWMRHRTGSFNEESGRYSVLATDFYEPVEGDVGAQSTVNRQGRGDPLPPEEQARFLKLLEEDRDAAAAHYGLFLEDGVARELARIGLPVSLYVRFYWEVNLHNLLHFLELRLDPHAQLEIREYATVLAQCAAAVAPESWAAFEEYRLKGVRLSKTEADAVRRVLRDGPRAVDPTELTGLRNLFGNPPGA